MSLKTVKDRDLNRSDVKNPDGGEVLPNARFYPRVTFGIIVLNGEPFLQYNLRALYPFAHQIIVVEGACVAAASLATSDGHSTDGTLEKLWVFKEKEDPDNKLVIVTAENEGRRDGFWSEKDEMSQAYARRATGDWLWQVDYDEFYLENDMVIVLEMLQSDPGITAVSFPYKQFWGGFDYLETGQWFIYDHPCFHRLFRWSPGYQYVKHRPPTVVDERGRDLRTLKWVSHKQMREMGIYLYHYSYVLPKQARQKVGYYTHVTWSDHYRDNERWLKEGYYGLTDPYFIGEGGRRMPQWLERYRGPHPAEIVKMREDLHTGQAKEPLRPLEDIEKLLSSPRYALGRWVLRAYLFVLWNARQVARRLRRFLAPLLHPVSGWVAESPSRRDPRLIWYQILTKGFRKAVIARYDAMFYEAHDELKPGYAKLADHIYDWAKPRSACDLGCGNGFLLYFLAQRGVEVFGVDGSPDVLDFVDQSLHGRVAVASLTSRQDFGVNDLAISTEVAEHLPKRASRAFVDNIVRSARKHIVFAAARPGQWGDGHINCQPRGFWIKLFMERGWVYDHQATEAFVSKVNNTSEIVKTLPWMLDNFMLFGRRCTSPYNGQQQRKPAVDRFHIVVSNYKRISCFVDNFRRIQGFDRRRDRVIIFDCSPDPDWQEQLAIAESLTFLGLRWGENLYFIRRRNWNVNHGAQLDYFRCLIDQSIPKPEYAAFMQDHYLDLKRFVKEDTIPENAVYDLDQVEAKFRSDPDIGCAFFSRYGIRVSTSSPISDKDFWGDGAELIPGAKRRWFLVDGGNFIVRPQLYLNWFKAHPHRLTQGFYVQNCWEVRLGKILCDQGIKWADMYRNIEYSTIEDLDAIEASRGEKVSMLWYDNRVWFFFGGRDMQSYPPKPLIPILRYFMRYIRDWIFHSRDKRLRFVWPSDLEFNPAEEVRL
ncbi:MAG: methyltransferase domain-containing protein [Thermodesulfobacteriota bacterium]|nr:methyltransferase domain-containing protein [Thermodesulfobacteriota bacterium]